MRALCASFLIFAAVALPAASAADLKVKVIDPQSAAVAGAQVSLLSKGSNTPLRVVATSAEGIAIFGDLSSSSYQIQVLAPGFAPHTEDVAAAHPDILTIQLHLATASETVVVTATRTLVPAGESGASISTLESSKPCSPSPPTMPSASFPAQSSTPPASAEDCRLCSCAAANLLTTK